MEPVSYEIRADDIEEVLTAYQVPEEQRAQAREHVLKHVLDVDDIAKAAPEIGMERVRRDEWIDGPGLTQPGDQSPARRELALAAIEDLLIRDGFLDLGVDDKRVFPATTVRDNERVDG